jgi:hypothetical protein
MSRLISIQVKRHRHAQEFVAFKVKALYVSLGNFKMDVCTSRE